MIDSASDALVRELEGNDAGVESERMDGKPRA